MIATHGGGCLCGGVRYEIVGPMSPILACHCGQCRKTSGHFLAATDIARADLRLLADATLSWFESSPGIRRGFCGRCGGNLFWERLAGEQVSVTAGTLDGATGLRLAGHIFTAYKGDYYGLEDDLPQHAERPPAGTAD